MNFTRVNSNKFGTTFRLGTPYIFTINDTSTMFGLEEAGKYGRYIKWVLENQDIINELKTFESNIQEKYKDIDIISPILLKENYPAMVQTKVPDIKNIDIISSDKGEVDTISEFIKKGIKYNLILEVKTIFVGKTNIKYTIYIKKIELRSKN